MKLTPYLIVLTLLLFSCSQDDEIVSDAELANSELSNEAVSADLELNLSEYDESHLGMYKGIFTTNDSQNRGVVEIKIINDELAKASLTLVNGQVIQYQGSVSQNSLSVVDAYLNMSFESVGPSLESTRTNLNNFVFHVNEDGSGALISAANLRGKPSSISILKETSRTALTMVTGSYVDDTGAFSDTFNVMFDSQPDADGASVNFTTQVMVNVVFLQRGVPYQ